MIFLYPVLAYFWPGQHSRDIVDYFANFWPYCLKTIYYNPDTGGPRWAHMWFVAYLFIYSILLIPLFSYVKKGKGLALMMRISEFLNKRGILIFSGLIFGLVFYILYVPFPFFQNNLLTDWGYFTYNLIAFLIGYIVSHNNQFWSVLEKSWKLFILFALICSGLVIWMTFSLPSFSTPDYNADFFLYSIIAGFNTWFCMLAVLSLSSRFLNRKDRFLDYFSNASYPFYILHLVLMIVIGYYLAELNLKAVNEFILLSVLSYATTIIFYDIFRRIRFMRFLLSIKSANKKLSS